ncbi:histidine utilization repressor [Rhizobium aquaticum]|uniref:histidine utilization repressor n=1 Tax=Rhizobium aquaticum TaxID=1549636 RepID=UPI00339404F9
MAATGDLSLHQQIVNDVEAKILAGDWPPGHRVPFEMELAEQYKCSRMTVNKAMSQLARAGLIIRRKKSGSFVSLPQVQSAVLKINEIRSEIESLGKIYHYDLLERSLRRANANDRAHLDMKDGKVLHLRSLHQAGDRPFCLEERIINVAEVPQSLEESFATTAPGGWLLQQVPWSTAEHTIQAINADSETAKRLAIAEGTACLVIERRTSSNAAHITHVRLTYPGNAHILVARFTPSQS